MRHYLSILQESMRARWEKPALSDYRGETFTFAQMATRIAKLHATFKAIGLEPGDKVALAGKNCARWAMSFMATATYRGVAVPILPDFAPNTIAGLTDHSESSVLFTGRRIWEQMELKDMPNLKAALDLDNYSIIYSKDEALVDAVAQIEQDMPSIIPAEKKIEATDYTFSNINDLAIINYTSGTTSQPKGVILTSGNISANIDFALAYIPVEDGDKIISMLPLAHMFGQLADFLYPFSAGATIYYLTKAPTPSLLLKAMADVNPYLVATVPLVIEKIYKKKLDPLLSKLSFKFCWYTPGIMNIVRAVVKKSLVKAFGGQVRYFLCGGAAMNPIVEKCLMDVSFPLSIGFGMTECGPLVSGTVPKYFRRRSCGQPVPNMEVMIDNPNEKGEGEILTRGENVMMGYYKNEEATRAAFTEDGWLRTGDLGYMDKKQFVYIRGRIKSMFLGASGQNIYPEEIEDKLNNQTGVAESVVVEREGKLIGLVFPDEDQTKNFSLDDLKNLMKENLKKLNDALPSYSRVHDIEIKEEPFEKTPKKSIKRFLYK